MKLTPLFACLLLISGARPEVFAIPTPKMEEAEMTGEADLAAEGQVVSVTLLKRWIGDRPGIDMGYEHGEFEATLRITKPLKGDKKAGQTIQYFVSAYMEGKWATPPAMGFVYEGTKDAITPGTKLRVFLKWNAGHKRYERIHFNSGFVLLEKSAAAYPKTVGVPIVAKDR